MALAGARRLAARPREASAVEDLAEGSGELIRLAHAAVLTPEESVVAAREGDGRLAEPPGPGGAAAAGHHPARFRADADNDTARCCPERGEVMPVGGARRHVQAEERVVAGAVVHGRQPEHGRIRPGLVRVTLRDR